ncbi:MAG: hypothetical protein HZB83_06595 [Deltaproteobacteria bacterium]|nr:hypothetical protein [Deltaproteobacteria bacterium]
MTSLAVLVLAAFILNLPFGYLRGKTKKFSFQWFLYIHLPIPAIFLMRTFAGIGITFVPVIAIGAVMGQFLGGRLYNNLKAL